MQNSIIYEKIENYFDSWIFDQDFKTLPTKARVDIAMKVLSESNRRREPVETSNTSQSLARDIYSRMQATLTPSTTQQLNSLTT